MAKQLFISNGKEYTYKDYILYSIAMHSGKMSGIPSISTSVLSNSLCSKHATVKGSICEKCYARNLVKMRKQLADKLTSNYEFYNSVALSVEDIPYINSAIFRFESFGDLSSVLHFANYCTIATANSQTRFVLWTKNPHLIFDYVNKGGVIPSNLYIIISSLFVNKSALDGAKALNKVLPFIDGVFTVYDKKTIETDNIDINCGGRKCLECRRCYSLEHGNIADIREQLK